MRIFLAAMILVAVTANASPSAASDWQYGCRGVLPSGDAPVIIFNRSSLIMLPKAWVGGSLLGSVNDQLLSSSFRASDNNSGLVPTMVFARDDHPDEKLTLTETSSKVISDVHRPAGSQPRSEQITTYRKVYRWVSDGIYRGPYEIKMDCVNYELSAPHR
ncbi:hypothetical protein ACFQZO_06725 [Bradyrhizobium sp. GCM10027634]|uniref:hypothetical protein n=1 Tax=unclassified Bradyrhizobium TaxID=2631580 RepID=UPI00188AF3F8|nr:MULTISPECIES: hypothetical protein [unclassified Bradyrhizobium]MDN5000571.1 hypothetical protein [Bradyrhizobium sp. WYCCWR 12677]QOZ42691.1 hypothetical protein XH89_03825 [Bradyrhizobium sp. CCBAU 53340]